jgi:hypothetical protein
MFAIVYQPCIRHKYGDTVPLTQNPTGEAMYVNCYFSKYAFPSYVVDESEGFGIDVANTR